MIVACGDQLAENVELFGSKAARLAQLYRRSFPVPPHVAIGNDVFTSAVQHCLGTDAFCKLEEIAVNRLDLVNHLQHLQTSLRAYAVESDIGADVYNALTKQGIDFPVAVRSSASDEDSSGHGMAGLYESIVNVNSVKQLSEAIGQCWASLYGIRAVLARSGQRLGLHDWKMAVLCQPYITGTCGGIVFTRDPLGSEACSRVEADPGGPEQVTAGQHRWSVTFFRTDLTTSDRQHDKENDNTDQQTILYQAAAHACNVEQHYGLAQDVEWIYDGSQIWILQARPQHSPQTIACPAEPYVRPVEEMQGDPPQEFGALAALHRRAQRKKLGLKRLCCELDVNTSRWYYVGLADKTDIDKLTTNLLANLRTPYLYVDVDQNVQGMNVKKSQLTDTLRQLACSASPRFLVVRVRESIPTEMALITSGTRDRIYVEYVTGAMKGLASGMSVPSSVTMSSQGDVIDSVQRDQKFRFCINDHTGELDPVPEQIPDLPQAKVLSSIARIHDEICDRLGDVSPEWWVWNGSVYLEDYGEIGSSEHLGSGIDSWISRGAIRGRCLFLSDIITGDADYMSHGYAVSAAYKDEDVDKVESIRRLRQAIEQHKKRWGDDAVLCADRPLLVISTVSDLVSGVVFKNASVLCHLAIILRQVGVPAVAIGDKYQQLKPGTEVMIDDDEMVVGQ